MSWATQRRLVVFLIIGAVVAALLATVTISAVYEAPSCSDNVMNQGESGIDCGGPCAYLCAELQQAPTVLFTKAIPNGEGRIDVVAEVENKNPDAAARNVPYTITLYGADQVLISKVTGKIDLPPSTIVPVFIPGVSSDNQAVAGAFLEIEHDSFKWFSLLRDPRIVPTASATLGGTEAAPRVEAVFTNPSATALTNIRAIVFVHNIAGDIIAASATLVPRIEGQGESTALFTWNGAFTGVPTRLEVLPVVGLP